MNIRTLLPLVLLSSAFALSACGNKGPLLPPPAPEDEEWSDGADDVADADDVTRDDAGMDNADDGDVDPALDADVDVDVDEDGDGDDPLPADEDGGGGA